MKKVLTIQKRIVLMGFIITFIMILLVIRLFVIQVVMGADYAHKAFQQRILSISIENVRGDILDRNGIPFTRGQEKKYLIMFPGLFHENNEIFSIVHNMTGISQKSFSNILKSSKPYVKKEILRSIPLLENEIEMGKYPGIMLIRQRTRYDKSSLARHVIGYLKKSDKTPVTGLEKEYDSYLNTGTSKMIYALTDVNRNIIPGIGYKLLDGDKPYYHLQLTLDYYMQKILEDALERYGGKSGGVVVKIDTGEILALASRPHYDQTDIEASKNQADSFWAIPMKAFPPGSVFKIVVAAAGLESGMFTGHTHFFCSGGIDINGVYYSCHRSIGGLGDITLREAFAHSCNDTFIRIASRVGGDAVIDMAHRFGLGQALDIGLDNEAGSLPDKAEYASAGIGNLAIGQGKVEVTPLQVADMITTIANGGFRKELKLVKKLISSSGVEKALFDKQEQEMRVISDEVASELRKWMCDVTDYGTGIRAFNDKIGGTAGKTGTPQVAGDPDSSYYGWFAGFFPRENPQYAIVIMNREEEEGGRKPALIFKDVAHGIWEYQQKLVEK